MFTIKQACKYLDMKEPDLVAALGPTRSHVFVNGKGETILHDSDIELIATRRSYAAALERERDLLKELGIGVIDPADLMPRDRSAD